MATIHVSNGPISGDYDIPDDCETVDQVLDFFRDLLNIPTGATPTLNGDPATGSARVSPGDDVSFTKTSGSKG